MTYALVALAFLLAGVAATATGGLIYFARKAMAASDAAASAMAQLDALKIADANSATIAAAAAEKAQEKRGDALEKEATDAEASGDPAGAIGRLSAQLPGVPAAAGPGRPKQ